MQDSALGGNVRTKRLAAGLTQTALADKAGLGLRTVQQIEAGDGTTVSTLYALARALDVDPGVLLDSPSDATERSA